MSLSQPAEPPDRPLQRAAGPLGDIGPAAEPRKRNCTVCGD